ncbi:MAG: diguanylate cyclase [Holophagales bacterium]|nr:MAG: diguanylate cyclase [Holophagales bacterium]
MRARAFPAVPKLRFLLGAAVVAALFLLQLWEDRGSAARRVGISMETRDGAVVVTAVTPGLPADRAGLKGGDRILSIAGRPLAGRTTYDEIASEFAEGVPVTFAVGREAGPQVLPVTPGTPFEWGPVAMVVLILAAYLALAGLVARQPEGDIRALLLQLFSLAVAFEFALPTGLIGSPTIALISLTLQQLINGVQFGLELHLASVLPDRPEWIRRRPWLIRLYYAVGLAFGFGVAGTQLLEGLGVEALPWSAEQAQAVLYQAGFPVWALAVAMLLGHAMLTHAEPRRRQQAGLVFLGILPWVASVLIGLVFDLAGIARWDWLDNWPLLVLPYPIAVFIAIYRYRLFDIELVVRRSLLYTALTSTLLLVFYAVLGAGGALFSHLVGGTRDSLWVVSGATLLLGLMFAPLRQSLQRLIDRRFFPERTALRQRLVDLASGLPARGKLPLMGQHLVGRLPEIFDVRTATLLLATPETGHMVTLASTAFDLEEQFDQSFLLAPDDAGIQMLRRSARPLVASLPAARSATMAQRLRRLGAELAVPLISQETMVGLLLLGEKTDGRPYTAEELELLSLLGHHVATVFENARLFESATYEGLTGLLRREAILDQLERELQRAARYRRPLSIALADLDHFKSINDRHGHLVGDLVLKRTAQAVALALRATDTVGRFGGEEFLVVLPETDLTGASAVAEKLREVVEELQIELEDGEVLGVTTSIGLASVPDAERPGLKSARDLLVEADRALYRAKAEGRNRIEPAAVVA